jgi:hypothetical protein
MDLGKVLTVSFDYERVTGTLNFSGTLGSQTLMVYIYDATAGGANWIQPAGFLGMNQSSGPGRVTATFQSSVVAGQKYRVAVIASQAVGSACSLEFDNFTCSRVTAPIGPVVTDWVNYTPTVTTSSGSVTNATHTGRWRRVGDSIEVRVTTQFSAASAAFTNILYSLPSGLSFDTSKFAGTTETQIGVSRCLDSGILMYAVGNSVYVDSTRFRPQVSVSAPSSSPVTSTVVTNTYPFTFGATGTQDTIETEIMAPIQGWSSATQLSSDSDTRVVAAAYLRSTAQTIPAATDTTVIYDTRRIDTHGAMNTSTGRFTAPVSGVYRISGSVFYNFFTPAAGNPLQMRFVKRSVAGVALEDTYKDNFTANAAVGQEIALRTTALFYCNAGETLEVILWQNTGASRTTIANINYVEIERLSGPSVVAASETVAYSGHRTAGNYAINNSNVTIVFNATGVDTHNAMNTSTGTYTVPVSGLYEVIGKATFTSGSIQLYTVNLFMAGQLTSQSFMTQDSSNGNYRSAHVTNVRRMNAGDQISMTAFSSLGSTVVCDSAVTNCLHIKRIGN